MDSNLGPPVGGLCARKAWLHENDKSCEKAVMRIDDPKMADFMESVGRFKKALFRRDAAKRLLAQYERGEISYFDYRKQVCDLYDGFRCVNYEAVDGDVHTIDIRWTSRGHHPPALPDKGFGLARDKGSRGPPPAARRRRCSENGSRTQRTRVPPYDASQPGGAVW
jgi:hypothetical protein